MNPDDPPKTGAESGHADVREVPGEPMAAQDGADLVALIDGLPDPLFVKDQAHRWILINDAFCEFMGHPREALLGRSDFEFFSTEEAAVFWAKDEEAFASDGVVVNEESVTDASGRQRWIVTHKRVYTLQSGRRVLVGTIRDVTELRAMRLRTGLAVDAARLGIWSVHGNTVALDVRVARLLGFDAATERSIDAFLTCFEPSIRAALRADLESDETVTRSVDARVRLDPGNPDAPPAWRDVRVHFHGQADGQRVGTLQDITAEVEAARSLADSVQRTEVASRAKSRFLAGMSHEIRTPMNAILGYTQLLLRDRGISGETRRRVDAIHRAGDHLLGLLNDVLDMARIESGRLEVNPTVVNLHALIAEVVDVFAGSAERSGLGLTLTIEPTVPDFVLVDSSKCRQILANLLDNAIKFTRRGSVDVIASARYPARGRRAIVTVEVSDTGVGIPSDDIVDVFSPFVRGLGQVGEPGAGLGLAISKHLAELIGGSLTAESTLGSGSAFTLRLQLRVARKPSVDEEHAPRIRSLSPGSAPTIAVVDDRPSNRLLFESILSRVGFAVRLFESGQAFLDALADDTWDAVLLDLRMTGLDGRATAVRVRAAQPDLPVVATSASKVAPEESAEFDAFVGKPVDVDALYRTLGELLGVEYVFLDESRIPTGATPVQPVSVLEISAELRRKMREAVETLDFGRVVELVDASTLSHAEKRALTGFAETYAADALLGLLGE